MLVVMPELKHSEVLDPHSFGEKGCPGAQQIAIVMKHKGIPFENIVVGARSRHSSYCGARAIAYACTSAILWQILRRGLIGLMMPTL